MRPLEGRRLFFVGIGGAGLSGYALLADAWGAEVSGWDRYETPYLEHVRDAGIPVEIGEQVTAAPAGAETVVSTAFAGQARGRTRAEFLAELVSLQDSIVVSGAHGKTTTAAMVAFVLDRLGRDPSFLIGADVPQLGGNARAGSGWLVVEGDESDRTVEHLRPKIAVVTNVDLDHHSEFRSRAEVEALFERWLAEVPTVVRGDGLDPYDGELILPGEHNRRNAAAALAALELAGFDLEPAAAALATFPGILRRQQLVGSRNGARIYDDYAHHPTEVAATLEALRELEPRRLIAVFQPHLYSRTKALAGRFGAALAAADEVGVLDVYPAREQPVGELAGVSGLDVARATADRAGGRPVWWLRDKEGAERVLAARLEDGDLLVTIGAGDVFELAEALAVGT